MVSKTRLLGLLSTVVCVCTLAAAAVTPGLRADTTATAPPVALSPTLQTDKALFEDRCSACHNLPDPVAKAYNRDQWQRTVDRMLTRYQASNSITPDEASEIVDYLATITPNGAGTGQTDPWAASTGDVWQTIPSATRIFTFSGPAALAGLTATASGLPGPLPQWHPAVSQADTTDGGGAYVNVNLPSPTPDRFALLVDRADTPRNVDVRARFQIVGGHASPSVGVVFGYTDSSHYYVLRYSQLQDDLVLIKIDGTTHTTLQETPRILPAPAVAGAPTPAAPAAAPAVLNVMAPPVGLGPGWHVLRLQVDNNTIRGWIDRNKRVNTSDTTYTGGKVALWSQGDTNAEFNSWIIDQYDNEPSTPAQ